MVKEKLLYALAVQAGLELGDVMQDIEEMADLVLELLSSDIWTISTDTITSFAEVVKLRYGGWGNEKEPPAKVIDSLRKAKFTYQIRTDSPSHSPAPFRPLLHNVFEQ